jgi:hypothetical protein
MKNQTIGVEIEMTGITKARSAEITANFLNGTVRRTYDTYDSYLVTALDGRVWKVMGDSSITAIKKVGARLIGTSSNDYRVELVTPILTYSDIETLQELVRLLRAEGAISDSKYQCAIHIHIGAKGHTPQTLKNLVNIIASKEELIYKSLEIDPARVRYCKKVREELIEDLNRVKPKTMDDLADIWYKGYGSESRSAHYNHSRYHGLNLHTVYTKGTVEFRLFNGTLHAGKIRSYIVLALAISHQALKQKSASAKRTYTENDKYTFRCWLLRLGLIGEEFKNCREHLMANLTGNSAWKTPRQAA